MAVTRGGGVPGARPPARAGCGRVARRPNAPRPPSPGIPGRWRSGLGGQAVPLGRNARVEVRPLEPLRSQALAQLQELKLRAAPLVMREHLRVRALRARGRPRTPPPFLRAALGAANRIPPAPRSLGADVAHVGLHMAAGARAARRGQANPVVHGSVRRGSSRGRVPSTRPLPAAMSPGGAWEARRPSLHEQQSTPSLAVACGGKHSSNASARPGTGAGRVEPAAAAAHDE